MNIESSPQRPGAFYEFWLVLKVHMHTWYNTSKSKGIKGLIGPVIGTLAYIALGVGFGYGSYKLLKTVFPELSNYPQILEPFETNIMMALGLSTVVLLLLTALSVLYMYIYDSEDMAFLMATPLRQRAVFSARLIEGYLMCLFSAVPLTFSPIIGYGIAKGASLSFYLTAVISFMALCSITLSLSALIIMLIMRFVPGQKMKQLLMVIGLMFGVVIVFASQYLSYSAQNIAGGKLLDFTKTISRLKLGDLPLLPHAWFGHSVTSAFPGRWENLGEGFIPLIIVGILTFFVVILISEWVYLTGWASNQETDRKKSKAKLKTPATAQSGKTVDQHPAGNNFLGRIFTPINYAPPTPFWGLVRKEMRLISREPMLWYNYIIGFVVIGFFIFNMVSMSKNPQQGGDMPETVKRYFIFFMMMFGVTIGGGTMAGTALSREGQGWTFLKACPLNPTEFYKAKLFGAALPSIITVVAGMVILALIPSLPGLPLYVSIPLGILIVVSMTSILLLSDVLMPNFDIKFTSTATGKSTGAGGLKISLVNLSEMVIFAIMGATLTFPDWFGQVGFLKDLLTELSARIIAYTIFALETFGVIALGWKMSAKRISRMLIGE